jgi:hypothetical protein
MPRTSKALDLGRKFVADEGSIMQYGLGVSLDFATFTDPKFGTSGKKVIPAGTIVELNAGGQAVVYDGTGQAYLTAAIGLEQEEQGGSYGTVGLIVGGVIFENLLPDANPSTGNITAPQKTGLGVNFVFQKHPANGVLGALT